MIKKVIAYIGTMKGEKSNTYLLVKTILEAAFYRESVKCEIITGRDILIKPCLGCNHCFKTGICCLDEHDDMKLLKNKILEASIVIFASPVYVHNVSGTMKNFIDRIGQWIHTMRLAGKYGIALSTNYTNGDDSVTRYLEEILWQMGTNVIVSKNIPAQYPFELSSDEWFVEKAEIIAKAINREICYPVNATEKLENIFLSRKAMFEYYKKMNYGIQEFEWWIENGLEKCENFKDLIEKIKK